MPLLNVVLHHHMLILLGNDVINEADLLTMVESVTAILDALHARVDELAIIWRRQRVNVDTQFEYYANGLLNNYYKVFRSMQFLSCAFLSCYRNTNSS